VQVGRVKHIFTRFQKAEYSVLIRVFHFSPFLKFKLLGCCLVGLG